MPDELIIERGEGWAQIRVNREAQRNDCATSSRSGPSETRPLEPPPS